MRRKILALLMGLVMIVALAGCANNQTTSDNQNELTQNDSSSDNSSSANVGSMKIGISMRETKNPFYKVMSDTIEADAKEKGYETVALDANNDIAQQTADLENLMAQGCNVVITDLLDMNAFESTIQKLRDAGIYVISINDGVGDTTPVNATVTTNNFGNGLLVGEWAASKFEKDETIKALVISGEIGNDTGLDRRTGTIQGIQEYQLAQYGKTDFEVVYQIYCDGWNVEVVNEKFEDVAPTLDFNCIISESDVLTQYCLDSLKSMGLRDKVLLTSAADGEKSCLQMIKSGELDVTAMNSPSELGHSAFDVAVKLMNGESVTGYVYTEPTVVYKDNVDEYYDPDSPF